MSRPDLALNSLARSRGLFVSCQSRPRASADEAPSFIPPPLAISPPPLLLFFFLFPPPLILPYLILIFLSSILWSPIYPQRPSIPPISPPILATSSVSTSPPRHLCISSIGIPAPDSVGNEARLPPKGSRPSTNPDVSDFCLTPICLVSPPLPRNRSRLDPDCAPSQDFLFRPIPRTCSRCVSYSYS
ncbi:hypothetical protein HDV62DRAFT_78547 [Trichoderma sp. SZMC 28011]